jgi:glycerol-3-phosphate acyltransferase PlsY
MVTIILVVLAYLFGSINFAIIACKLAGLPDPRSQGSKNPGATNVLRVGGKKLAAAVAVGDALKGVLPVIIAHFFNQDGFCLALVALAAVLGHMYPVFFRFQGGKGVATALGAVMALSWFVGILVLLTWGAIALIFRWSSLASLLSLVLMLFYISWFASTTMLLPLIIMVALILYRHRANIGRLLKGTEPKIGEKK